MNARHEAGIRLGPLTDDRGVADDQVAVHQGGGLARGDARGGLGERRAQ